MQNSRRIIQRNNTHTPVECQRKNIYMERYESYSTANLITKIEGAWLCGTCKWIEERNGNKGSEQIRDRLLKLTIKGSRKSEWTVVQLSRTLTHLNPSIFMHKIRLSEKFSHSSCGAPRFGNISPLLLLWFLAFSFTSFLAFSLQWIFHQIRNFPLKVVI